MDNTTNIDVVIINGGVYGNLVDLEKWLLAGRYERAANGIREVRIGAMEKYIQRFSKVVESS